MEDLEAKIAKFLSVSSGDGDGSGSGSGSGDGDGSGDGSGYGSGYGYGYGYGYGSGYGYGDGDGDGDGSGDGDGDGSGDGDGVSIFNGEKVYMVDDVPTIIRSVRDNVATGAILRKDLTLTPCYIVKENDKFAHGETLHDAFTALQEKLYDDSTEEERLAAFKAKFPDYDTPYPNTDLFSYHHVLTGSCKMGREAFVKDNGLTLDGKTTVREFVKLTEDAYGGDVVKQLPELYGE